MVKVLCGGKCYATISRQALERMCLVLFSKRYNLELLEDKEDTRLGVFKNSSL